jgi:carboxypeptidase C (cathepsin A)
VRALAARSSRVRRDEAGRRGAQARRAGGHVVLEEPVVTHHQIMVGGKPLKYTVTTGITPAQGETGETEANVFFMATRFDGVANPQRAR